MTKRRPRGERGSDLFGPDLSDRPFTPIEEVGDRIEVWSAQFVNRWVFLAHQRPDALAELRELLAAVRGAAAS